ncbi:hypothetical protein E1B28_010579 [Marasmius oreades]|uniref:Uncharacterized protein n=1 Tax=Marasmius oreades TaxID=181124 RepID=A0A9P7URX2_9AGAR|nr:uncharacterized protein E1B28_010579 [Marasmius oreades]KAG7091550.1 hypothetical protein E1B28_010579 [Marasmius oreades]
MQQNSFGEPSESEMVMNNLLRTIRKNSRNSLLRKIFSTDHLQDKGHLLQELEDLNASGIYKIILALQSEDAETYLREYNVNIYRIDNMTPLQFIFENLMDQNTEIENIRVEPPLMVHTTSHLEPSGSSNKLKRRIKEISLEILSMNEIARINYPDYLRIYKDDDSKGKAYTPIQVRLPQCWKKVVEEDLELKALDWYLQKEFDDTKLLLNQKTSHLHSSLLIEEEQSSDQQDSPQESPLDSEPVEQELPEQSIGTLNYWPGRNEHDEQEMFEQQARASHYWADRAEAEYGLEGDQYYHRDSPCLYYPTQLHNTPETGSPEPLPIQLSSRLQEELSNIHINATICFDTPNSPPPDYCHMEETSDTEEDTHMEETSDIEHEVIYISNDEQEISLPENEIIDPMPDLTNVTPNQISLDNFSIDSPPGEIVTNLPDPRISQDEYFSTVISEHDVIRMNILLYLIYSSFALATLFDLKASFK